MINISNLLNENQDPKAVEKVMNKLEGILMSGETVQYMAVQKKPAVNISPDCVALTNRRIIFCRPKNLGLSMEFEDCIWKDVADCHFKEEILGGVFTMKTIKGKMHRIDYLPKVQARKLYTLAQEQEETQRETRRQREMEELRAGAGGIVVNTPNVTATQPVDVADPIQTLQKLKTMLENGLITNEEYEGKKAEILQRM